MANQILPQDLIDLKGLRDETKATIKDLKDFEKTGNAMLKTFENRTKDLREEMKLFRDTLKSLNPTNPQFINGLRKNSDGLTALEKQTRLVAEAQKIMTDAMNASKKGLTELTSNIKTVEKAYGALITSEQKESAQAVQMRGAISALSKELNGLKKGLQETKKATDDAVGSYNAINKAMLVEMRELKAIGNAYTDNSAKTKVNNERVKELTRSIKQKNDALKEMDRALGNNQRNVGDYGSAISVLEGNFRGLVAGSGKAALAIAALGAAFNALSYVKDVAIEFQRFNTVINNLSTSTAAAESNTAFLKNTANAFGLDLLALADGFKQWVGATKDTALAGDQLQKIFHGVAAASATMNLGIDDTKGAIRALSQMMKGESIQAEELTGQLGERIPAALRLLSKETGMSTTQLRKLMKDGELLSVVTLPQLGKALEQVYGVTAQNNLNTIVGSANRLTNLWKELLSLNSGPLATFLTFMNRTLGDIVLKLKNVAGSGGGLAASVGVLNGIPNAGAENYSRQQNVLGSFSQMTKDDRFASLKAERTIFNSLLTNYNKYKNERSDAENQAAAELVISQKKHYDNLLKLNGEYNTADGQAAAEAAAVKLKNQNEDNEKAEKKQATADNKRRADLRRSYQTELRDLQAKEDAVLYSISRSEAEGLITSEQATADRLKVSTEFRDKELELMKSYSTGRINLEEELTDDLSRVQKEREKNELDAARQNTERLKNLYRDIIEDLSAELTQLNAEAGAAAAVVLDRVDSEFNKRQSQNNRARIRATSDINGVPGKKEAMPFLAYDFDIKSMTIELDRFKAQFAAMGQVYDQFQGDARAAYQERVIELRQSGMNEIELEKALVKAKAEFEDQKLRFGRVRMREEEDNLRKQTVVEGDIIETGLERIEARREFYHERQMERMYAIFDLAQQINGDLLSIYSARYEREIQIQEEARDRNLDGISKDAKNRADIEKAYAAKISAIRRKQAAAEKVSALFGIALNTAVAVTKAAPNPVLMALAIAAGVSAAATVIAKPVPQYFKGKKLGDSYEGPAIIADRGPEIKERKGKKELFTTPTLTYVDKDTRIHTNAETVSMLGKEKKRQYMDSVTSSVDYASGYARRKQQYKHEETAQAFQYLAAYGKENGIKDEIKDGFKNITVQVNQPDGTVVRTQNGNTVRDRTRTKYFK